MSQALTFTQMVNAPPASVYYALTNAIALREWLCDDAMAHAREGGYLFLGWDSGCYASGSFIALEPEEAVAFTWQGRGEPGPTEVRISLEEKSGGAFVTLAHGEIGSGEAWAATVEEFKKGWETGLENLASVLETGVDLRVARRPMLGIVGGEELNDKIIAALGVPVTEGVRIAGVVEDMEAEAARLQPDDVMVSLGEQPVGDFQSLVAALTAYQAGDEVEVILYRGAEQRRVTMELSRCPTPEVPPTAGELAEAVREIYTQSDAELAALFEGVTDADASHQPAPGEWSAKQVLGRLIADEREVQTRITSLIRGDELNVFVSNVTNPVDGVVTAYPIVSGLLDELKRAELGTVVMAAALPEEFIARKGSYLRLGTDLLFGPYHLNAHADQIQGSD